MGFHHCFMEHAGPEDQAFVTTGPRVLGRSWPEYLKNERTIRSPVFHLFIV